MRPASPLQHIFMKYSFIIPVFNRPDEVDELLESLTRQTLRDFAQRQFAADFADFL